MAAARRPLEHERKSAPLASARGDLSMSKVVSRGDRSLFGPRGINSAPAGRLLTGNLAASAPSESHAELRVDSRLERVRKRTASGRPISPAIMDL